jgi:hypothetical protein
MPRLREAECIFPWSGAAGRITGPVTQKFRCGVDMSDEKGPNWTLERILRIAEMVIEVLKRLGLL